MKQLSIILLSLILLTSCSKDEAEGGCNPDITLPGSWLLIETLADPGDGSGIYQPVESNETYTFRADGTFTLSNSICNEPIDGTYTTENLAFDVHNCDYHDDIYRYEHCGTTLIIYPLCFEACGNKYQKR